MNQHPACLVVFGFGFAKVGARALRESKRWSVGSTKKADGDLNDCWRSLMTSWRDAKDDVSWREQSARQAAG